MKEDLLATLRSTVLTLVICAVAYPLALLAFAQTAVPEAAQGSLVRGEDGRSIGSERIAQAFTRPEYVWPRPSAVDYDAAASGGSNLGPSNPELRARVVASVSRFASHEAVQADELVPADLVTASGSGLDPHLTLAGAIYQAERIAAARGSSPERVRSLLERTAEPSLGGPIVNVLRANLLLDSELPTDGGGG